MKIRTDKEYVLALRAMYEYADVKAAIEKAEGNRYLSWSCDRKAFKESYDILAESWGVKEERLVDAEACAEIARGGVDLIGMNEAEGIAAQQERSAVKLSVEGDPDVVIGSHSFTVEPCFVSPNGTGAILKKSRGYFIKHPALPLTAIWQPSKASVAKFIAGHLRGSSLQSLKIQAWEAARR